MKLTGLDLGVVTGVCFGESPGGAPRFASWNLRSDDKAERGLKLMGALNRHLTEFEPEVIYLEAPANLTGMVRQGTNIDTLTSLYGYDMLCRVVAASRGVRLETVDSQAARFDFLGFKPKKGEGKKAVAHRCATLGWSPANNNESDAAAVWSFGVGRERPSAQLELA